MKGEGGQSPGLPALKVVFSGSNGKILICLKIFSQICFLRKQPSAGKLPVAAIAGHPRGKQLRPRAGFGACLSYRYTMSNIWGADPDM
jgi:hypothetical protein